MHQEEYAEEVVLPIPVENIHYNSEKMPEIKHTEKTQIFVAFLAWSNPITYYTFFI